MDIFIDLMNEVVLQQVLIHPDNEKPRKYFLKTFLNINDEIINKKEEILYKGILNHIDIDKHGFTSDIIIRYEDYAARINIYNARNDDFIIHILYGSVSEESGKLLELRFIKNPDHKGKVIEDNYLKNTTDPNDKTFADLLKIKNIDLNRIQKLDNSTATNRWLKFITAQNNEERYKACASDEVLLEFYNWLKE